MVADIIKTLCQTNLYQSQILMLEKCLTKILTYPLTMYVFFRFYETPKIQDAIGCSRSLILLSSPVLPQLKFIIQILSYYIV